MGIFTRSKSKPSPPSRTATEPPLPPRPQQFLYQLPYGPPPPPQWINGQHTQTSPGRSQSYPPPASWAIAPPPPLYLPCQQVFVSNYLLPAPQPHVKSQKTGKKPKTNKPKSASVTNLLQVDMPSFIPGAQIFNNGAPALHQQGTQYLNQGAALYDLISSKFDAVLTGIDGERFSGDERELYIYQPPQWQQTYPEEEQGNISTKALGPGKDKNVKNKKGNASCPIASSVSTNYFAKVNLYANSRLPRDLPPVKLYIPIYPILCIAAQYSERVYTRPTGPEREAHVDANWHLGTKAMVIKSIPMDSADLIVFAIRGSQTFLDWAVNLNSAPTAPTGFLPDAGNLCHAGFLSVAKKMVKPVAARLRALLEDDPRRSKCSLLITGHSAGGAVAALLYTHMLSSCPETESELNILTGCFRRIHCITFGAPPVSLLPLAKPSDQAFRKSIFFGFVNEGDPVVRADKAYVRSLLDLYYSPVPRTKLNAPKQSSGLGVNDAASKTRLLLTSGKAAASTTALIPKKNRPAAPKHSKSEEGQSARPLWKVPVATLSNAGKLILLRGVPWNNGNGNNNGGSVGFEDKNNHKVSMDDGVQARSVTDEQLRSVVFGDPVCHMMKLYARRIEVLATNAIIGQR